MVAVPVTVSMTLDERDHLDAWARAHDMTRSAAIRSVIRQLRWPGQERLDSFSGSPPPKAFAELVEASEAASRARQADTQPPETVADVLPVCFGMPSDLLNGRCGNLPRGREYNPHALACPVCWPEGPTIYEVKEMARDVIRQQREANARAMYEDMMKRLDLED